MGQSTGGTRGRRSSGTKPYQKDPEGIMLSEISQMEKDKNRMISLICRISKK